MNYIENSMQRNSYSNPSYRQQGRAGVFKKQWCSMYASWPERFSHEDNPSLGGISYLQLNHLNHMGFLLQHLLHWEQAGLQCIKAPSRAVKMIKVSTAEVAGFKLSFDAPALKQQEQLEKANRKANQNCRSLVELQISRLPETRRQKAG